MAIHQEISLSAAPEKVYKTLTESNAFSGFTNAAASIDAEDGGAFTCFDGNIVGRNVELHPNELIVQAWRVGGWPPGIYSIVRIELAASADGTQLTLDHAGFPEAGADHLDGGWHKMYWDPLKKYLEG